MHIWYVLVNQSVEVDCEDHVVPPVKFLEQYDSNQSAASLTLHENAVHVQLTSGTSSPNREKKDHQNLLPVLEVALEERTNCYASGLGGFVRRYPSTRNLRITSSSAVPCTLCHTLYSVTVLSKNTHETTKKKKKKKDCQMSVYHKADPGELIQ